MSSDPDTPAPLQRRRRPIGPSATAVIVIDHGHRAVDSRLLLGAAGAAALGRRGSHAREEERRTQERERMRDELKAISWTCCDGPGDSLAQRMSESRRAEEEQPPARWPAAPRSSRGSCSPCTRSWARWRASSRAWSASSRAWSASAAMDRRSSRRWCAR